MVSEFTSQKVTAAVKLHDIPAIIALFIIFAGLDEQLLDEQIRKKVLFELRRTTYRWTPLKYDFYFPCHNIYQEYKPVFFFF